MSTRTSILAVSVLVIGGLSVGHLARRWLPQPIVNVQFGSEVPYNVKQTPGELPSGDELVMVYITSPECGSCTDPELASLVREAATALRDKAASDSATLVSVGVSANWVPGEGWRFLEQIMNFDEVVIGRNWLNSKVVDLGWSYPNAQMTMPQIVVYRQKVVAPSNTVRASIVREAPAVRMIGPDQIRRWVELGCPLE